MTDRKETREASEVNDATFSQMILAPLNSIFKAQIHAARAFLSFVLQIGYDDPNTKEIDGAEKKDDVPNALYAQEFCYSDNEGKKHKVVIPTLALAPFKSLNLSRQHQAYIYPRETPGIMLIKVNSPALMYHYARC